MRALLLAFVVLTILAPSVASASDASFALDLEKLKDPMMPLADVERADFRVRVACDAIPEDEPAEIFLEIAQAPGWANASLAPRVLSAQRADCIAGNWTGEGELTVRLDSAAPAFHPATITVRASLASANQTLETSNQTRVQADFYSILDVQIVEAIQEGEPQSVLTYPLRLTNHGNAPLRVTFTLTDAPGKLTVTIPPPLILESAASGGERTSATINVSMLTPHRRGYMNEMGLANLVIESEYALDPLRPGDSSNVSLLARTKGWYVPAPGALPALAVLAVAALVLRRRL